MATLLGKKADMHMFVAAIEELLDIQGSIEELLIESCREETPKYEWIRENLNNNHWNFKKWQFEAILFYPRSCKIEWSWIIKKCRQIQFDSNFEFNCSIRRSCHKCALFKFLFNLLCYSSALISRFDNLLTLVKLTIRCFTITEYQMTTIWSDIY